MAASITDKFRKSYSLLSKSLSSGINNTDTTIPLNNVTNIPTDTAVDAIIDRVDSNGNSTPTTREFIKGVVSGGNLINCVRGLHGTTAQSHLSGAVVEFTTSAVGLNDMVDGLIAEHNQDGTHSTTLVTARTEDTAPDGSADYVLTYDNSATALKKVKPDNLVRNNTQLTTGWISSVLPAVSSVTNNGNRSYDVTFASTVASYLTPGQRIRTTRTSAAPTQCTSLNGTTQYWVKTSPNKLTFTNNFVVSAWIKLSSYAVGTICSRYSGGNGWSLDVNASGQVRLAGYSGGAGNNAVSQSYQSLPLNKWVHVAAQLDMSTTSVGSTNNYIMIDGVEAVNSFTRAGTNPTSLTQAGNLEIGSAAAGTFWSGKIAQVAIYNAKVTQANILATISQGLTGSETSLASAYSFNNSTSDLNTSTPNDLSAGGGSPTATNADSPFGGQADGTISSTLDYGIVTKVSTTVATVQVPEGCTIPTTGGVTSVDLSPWKAPYNMPISIGKWYVENLYLVNVTSGTLTAATWKSVTGVSPSFPVGAWELGLEGCFVESGGSVVIDPFVGLGTTADAQPDYRLEQGFYPNISGTAFKFTVNRYADVNLSTATTYYLNVKATSVSSTVIGIDASSGAFAIRAKNAYL